MARKSVDTKEAVEKVKRNTTRSVAEGKESGSTKREAIENPYCFQLKLPPEYEFELKEAVLKKSREKKRRVSINEYITDLITAALEGDKG